MAGIVDSCLWIKITALWSLSMFVQGSHAFQCFTPTHYVSGRGHHVRFFNNNIDNHLRFSLVSHPLLEIGGVARNYNHCIAGWNQLGTKVRQAVYPLWSNFLSFYVCSIWSDWGLATCALGFLHQRKDPVASVVIFAFHQVLCCVLWQYKLLHMYII